MPAKSQSQKGKATPKKKTSKSAPKKATAAKKSAPSKKTAKTATAKKSAPPKKAAKTAAAKKSAPPKKAAKTAAAKKSAPPKESKTVKGKAIPLDDFVSMTYLTVQGVKDWLKKGRLTGSQDGSGQWMIDAANLEVPDIKRLVR